MIVSWSGLNYLGGNNERSSLPGCTIARFAILDVKRLEGTNLLPPEKRTTLSERMYPAGQSHFESP